MPEAVCPAELGPALLSEDDSSSPSSTPGHQESAPVTPGTPLPHLIAKCTSSSCHLISIKKKPTLRIWFTLTLYGKHHTGESQRLQELSTALHTANLLLKSSREETMFQKSTAILLLDAEAAAAAGHT